MFHSYDERQIDILKIHSNDDEQRRKTASWNPSTNVHRQLHLRPIDADISRNGSTSNGWQNRSLRGGQGRMHNYLDALRETTA